jgi:hypothetical protein
MRYKEFKGFNVNLSFKYSREVTENDNLDDIPNYIVPAYFKETSHAVIVCGQLNAEEIQQINKTGEVYIRIPFNKDGSILIPDDTLLRPSEDEFIDIIGDIDM